ncbi:hypothetical protein CASFOL_035833 [Castilleja foliolosa]|uniref:Peroxidase n=1 Tax=Castilleja foliolosa TaxID=1961234 RepID=A0ABD3BVB3_9LAMI
MGFHFINHRVFITIIFLISLLSNLTRGQTTLGFYNDKCSGPFGAITVESIVFKAIKKHFDIDPTIAPKLLRMHFHDCFVNGCDGSILLDGPASEKTAIPNLSLKGFDAIDEAKAQLEAVCPGVVSCADILALAARDSVLLTRGIGWLVPMGRRDGNVSLAINTINLPAPNDNVTVQIKKFNDKGLNVQDLVTLVGGHTIGTAGCVTFSNRLYNFSNSGRADPSIDPSFLPTLQKLCPLNGDGSVRVALDTGSEKVFDNGYFENIRAGQAVLESDQRLWAQGSTRAVVQRYVGGILGISRLVFNVEFGKSMVRMSKIGVLTGTQGQIRRVCSALN